MVISEVELRCVIKEIEKFTGLTLQKIPRIEIEDAGSSFYFPSENRIQIAKKDSLGEDRFIKGDLVHELTHALLQQNQHEWLPSFITEGFVSSCEFSLSPPSKETVARLKMTYEGRSKFAKSFIKLEKALIKIEVDTNAFLTRFCSEFNKILLKTCGKYLSEMDFRILERFDELNNPVAFPFEPYYCTSEDLAQFLQVERSEVDESLENLKAIAKIRHGNGTMHPIIRDMGDSKYMTDYTTIGNWVLQVIEDRMKLGRNHEMPSLQ